MSGTRYEVHPDAVRDLASCIPYLESRIPHLVSPIGFIRLPGAKNFVEGGYTEDLESKKLRKRGGEKK